MPSFWISPYLRCLIPKELEAPITVNDVTKAIKELKINKRPGPDGYSAIYYRTFAYILSPILTEAFKGVIKVKKKQPK